MFTEDYELDDLGIRVRFDEEDLCTEDSSFWIYVTMNEAIAEHSNRGKSENIKWGIRESVRNGTSGLYDRKCYGYTHDDGGHLIVDPDQAAVVRLIFDLYLSGYSVLKIIRELQARGIPSPRAILWLDDIIRPPKLQSYVSKRSEFNDKSKDLCTI